MSEHDDNQERAEQRTDWAEDRTIMANERTFASWTGTGLGAIGVAIGLKAVFGEFEPTWAAKAVASVFLIMAVGTFWAARTKACKTLNRLHERDLEPHSTRTLTFISASLSIAAIGTGVILWSL